MCLHLTLWMVQSRSPRLGGSGKNWHSKWGLDALGLQTTRQGRGPLVLFTHATPRRAAPTIRFCDSYSPCHQSRVQSKQILKIPSLEEFTTADSHLGGKQRPFRGSLLRTEMIFKSRRSLPSIAMQGGLFGAKHTIPVLSEPASQWNL